MRLVSFCVDCFQSFGAVVDHRVYDLKLRSRDSCATLESFINEYYSSDLTALLSGEAEYSLSEIVILPPILQPKKIFCVGINYGAHAVETDRGTLPQPSIFLRAANTLIAHEENVWKPRVSDRLDFEGELACIVGRSGRHISRRDAMTHIAGFTCFNDISVRDFQEHSITAGKNFYRTAPIGPYLVTPESIEQSTTMKLETRLNGVTVQQTTTDLMIYQISEIIEYISRITPLEPGDIISTGTPGGVGALRDPPVWMKAGDVVEVEISGIGILRNSIVDEPEITQQN